MKQLISGLVLGGALLGGCAHRGGDHAEILRVTQDFFDAMEHRDVELASRVMVPEGSFVYRRSDEGSGAAGSFTNAEWMGRLASRESEVRESFTGSPLILVEGDVAVLWGEYEFEVNGELQHTGIDAITYVRTSDGWKIASGAFSVIIAE